MTKKLITYGFIAVAFLFATPLSFCAERAILVETTAPPPQQLFSSQPLASQLAGKTVPATSAVSVMPSSQDSGEKLEKYKITTFYSDKPIHQLTQAQLKKFNNLYLSSLPEKSDVISPTIKRTMDTHYDLFTANYRVQSPLVWTGDLLAGWGMLPHSGGSSRAEFFIHRNGQALVVITLENEQFHFGAEALLTNSYVAQELATSAKTH